MVNHKQSAGEQRKARLEQKLHEAQQLKAELAQRAQKGGEQPKHKSKMLAILIFTLIAIGLLVLLLFVGPKIFAGKAISYDLALLTLGQGGIPRLTGSVAPGEQFTVPVVVAVGPSDGNVFDFGVQYEQTALNFDSFTPSLTVSILEQTLNNGRFSVQGTVIPPDSFQTIKDPVTTVVELGTLTFTVQSTIASSTRTLLSAYQFTALDTSNANIVAQPPLSARVDVEVPAVSTCTDVDNDGYCLESAGTLPSGKLGWNDCNDASMDVWEYRLRYLDTDQDGYPNPGAVGENICSGGERPYGYTDLSSPIDSCPNIVNNVVLDTDGDGIWDACDIGAACTTDTGCGTGLRCGTGGVCEAPRPSVLGDADSNGCLAVTEYNNFKYEFKNGLLPAVTAPQYNNVKYEFKNNLNSIRCS